MIANSVSDEKIKIFLERFPRFLDICKTLNQANVPFLVGGSGCLFLLGNDRVPDDVDMFLPDEMHDKADGLFCISSFKYESNQECVRNSNPFDEHLYQLTSHLQISVAGKNYHLSIQDHQLKQSISIRIGDVSFNLLPAEDVLLIKALLQRGEDVGKRDVQDIDHFLSFYQHVDRDYLKSRIDILNAQERLKGIFDIV